MLAHLLTPTEAAREMRISVATITRCVKRGAPVHRWGSTGYRYRIDLDEFIRWMEAQGPVQIAPVSFNPTLTVQEMAAQNRARLRAL